VAARFCSIPFHGIADERGLADGEAVWSWRPDAGVKFAKDALRVSRVMVTTKPGHQGEPGVSRQTTVQGRPAASAQPVVPAPCIFFTHGGRGCQPASGLPCALSLKKGVSQNKTCGNTFRENADVCPTVIAGHGRSKNGVACARLPRSITARMMDARVKLAHGGIGSGARKYWLFDNRITDRADQERSAG
jgi:hypothetical protein